MSPYIAQYYLISPNVSGLISPNVTLYCPILLYTAQCHPIFKKILKTIPNIALSLPKSPYEVPNFFTATLGPMTILNIKKY